MKYGIGIDIGGTKCSVVSADPSCVTLDPKNDFLTKRVFETDVFDYNKMNEFLKLKNIKTNTLGKTNNDVSFQADFQENK